MGKANIGALFGPLPTMLLGFLAIAILLAVGIYVYMALAYMRIAKKTKTEPAWLAWIPVANLYLFSKIAQMHWWPMLLLIGFIIPVVNIFAGIIFAVFFFIWQWKIFERVGKPGWWPLLTLIPLVGPIIFLVLLGVAAWGK